MAGMRTKTKAGKMKKMLEAASVPALELLIQTMQNEEVKLDVRLDCAREVMNRAYGKSQQIAGETKEEPIQIVLADEVKRYAE